MKKILLIKNITIKLWNINNIKIKIKKKFLKEISAVNKKFILMCINKARKDLSLIKPILIIRVIRTI